MGHSTEADHGTKGNGQALHAHSLLVNETAADREIVEAVTLEFIETCIDLWILWLPKAGE